MVAGPGETQRVALHHGRHWGKREEGSATAPSVVRPRAEGAECLQAPRHPAAELAVTQPFGAFCRGLWHRGEQRYACHLLFLSSDPVPVQNQPKPCKIQEKTKY